MTCSDKMGMNLEEKAVAWLKILSHYIYRETKEIKELHATYTCTFLRNVQSLGW
jgi:hypothetical protein